MNYKTNSTKIKRIVTISLISALAGLIGVIDKTISMSIFSYVPGIKIGLANVIILSMIYVSDMRCTLVVVLMKSFIVGFIIGGITTFIISFAASISSFVVMYIIRKIMKDIISIISVSLIGGTIHILVQLIVIKFIYHINNDVFYYGIILFVVSIVTSIIIGILANKIIKNNQILQKINI